MFGKLCLTWCAQRQPDPRVILVGSLNGLLFVLNRKLHEAGTNEKISSVNEKLQVATSTLQQAIGGISQNVSSGNEKV